MKRYSLIGYLTQDSFNSARRPYCPPQLWNLPTYVTVPTIREDIVEFFEDYEEDEHNPDRTPPHRDFLSIMHSIPFIIPFDKRVNLFRQLIYQDKFRFDD